MDSGGKAAGWAAVAAAAAAAAAASCFGGQPNRNAAAGPSGPNAAT